MKLKLKIGKQIKSQKRLTPAKIVLMLPIQKQRNSLAAKATAVLCYHLLTFLDAPPMPLPFQSWKF